MQRSGDFGAVTTGSARLPCASFAGNFKDEPVPRTVMFFVHCLRYRIMYVEKGRETKSSKLSRHIGSRYQSLVLLYKSEEIQSDVFFLSTKKNNVCCGQWIEQRKTELEAMSERNAPCWRT